MQFIILDLWTGWFKQQKFGEELFNIDFVTVIYVEVLYLKIGCGKLRIGIDAFFAILV